MKCLTFSEHLEETLKFQIIHEENSLRSLRDIKFSLAQSILLPGDSFVHEQISDNPEHHLHHADNADTSEEAQCATCNIRYITKLDI